MLCCRHGCRCNLLERACLRTPASHLAPPKPELGPHQQHGFSSSRNGQFQIQSLSTITEQPSWIQCSSRFCAQSGLFHCSCLLVVNEQVSLAGHGRSSLQSCRLHAAAESVASTSDQDDPLVDETGTVWPAKKQVIFLSNFNFPGALYLSLLDA